MRALTEASRTGAWAGERAFVVGSGPSLRGFPFEALRGEHTIGCNEEFRWGPEIAICQDVRFFFGDGSRTPAKDDPAWYARPGTLPVFFKGHPDRPDPPVVRDEIFTVGAAHEPGPPGEGVKFVWGKTLEEGLAYGANCGVSAVNLAYVLGADPIYLLGFDCGTNAAGKTHYHAAYPESWKMAPAAREEVFALWRKDWAAWAPNLAGRTVINLGPTSALDCFPRESTCVLESNCGIPARLLIWAGTGWVYRNPVTQEGLAAIRRGWLYDRKAESGVSI